MPYVSVPKDFKNVKNKIVLGMTKRQLIAAASGVVLCVAVWFSLHRLIGNAALYIMGVMFIPFIAAGWYKHRDGRPIEKVVLNYIRVRYLLPQTRPYTTTNIYTDINLTKQIREVIEDAAAAEQDKNSKKARPLCAASKKRSQKGKKTG